MYECREGEFVAIQQVVRLPCESALIGRSGSARVVEEVGKGSLPQFLPAVAFVGLGVALTLLGVAGWESHQINQLKSQLQKQQQALTQQQAETAARQQKIDAIKAIVCN